MFGESLLFFIGMLVVFVLPFLLLVFASQPFQRWIAKSTHSIKLIDLLSLYFFMAIHIFSEEWTGQSWIPYILIFISLLGILLALLFRHYNSYFPFRHFFKVFWRVFDLILLLVFFISGTGFLVTYWL